VKQLVEYRADENSFRVLLCTNGCGTIFMDDGEYIKFFRGDCIFFPADSQAVCLHGKAQFLDVRG
ncbi:MAG: cupin domain-containing protein, partial [Anaerovibrio sp.]|nr:cupin domain-containing protein [Anaerovibrio sp.]